MRPTGGSFVQVQVFRVKTPQERFKQNVNYVYVPIIQVDDVDICLLVNKTERISTSNIAGMTATLPPPTHLPQAIHYL
jgi:hypothetical protein